MRPQVLYMPGAKFTKMDLTLILAEKSTHMPNKELDEITNPFPNFNGCTVEVWDGSVIHPTLYDGCNYLSILGVSVLVK